jgi:hypothetical protein
VGAGHERVMSLGRATLRCVTFQNGNFAHVIWRKGGKRGDIRIVSEFLAFQYSNYSKKKIINKISSKKNFPKFFFSLKIIDLTLKIIDLTSIFV